MQLRELIIFRYKESMMVNVDLFVYGNTLVNRNVEYDKTMKIGQNVNANGTMIELQGTKDSEIQVSLDGHSDKFRY